MGKQIYVVEDDAAIRESTIELFTTEGYEVLSAENGQSALDYLCSAIKLPDLILLDMAMPVKNGLQFCAEQASNQKIAHIPVIIMSADNQIKLMQEKVHACAYIKKPTDIDQMLETVKKYCP